MPGLMTVKELRMALGQYSDGRFESEETLRFWIKSGTCPFAQSVKRGERTIFLIFRARFEKWKAGLDLAEYIKQKTA